MKKKISITIEEDILEKLSSFVSKGTFRNKSHAFEFALNKVINEQDKSAEEEGR